MGSRHDFLLGWVLTAVLVIASSPVPLEQDSETLEVDEDVPLTESEIKERDHYMGFRIGPAFQCKRLKFDSNSFEFRVTLQGFLERLEPVVVEGAAFEFAPRWTLADLKAKVGNATARAKLQAPLGQPLAQTHEERRKKTELAFAAFVDQIEAADTGLYVGLPGISRQDMKQLAKEVPFPKLFAELFDLTHTCLTDSCPASNGNDYPHKLGIWVGKSDKGTKSGMHTDSYENVYALLSGKKRFVLASPNAALHFQGARSIEFVDHLGHSPVAFADEDPELPDYERFPGMRQINFGKCDLSAGDMLYVPRYFFHQVHSVGTAIAVNWFALIDEEEHPVSRAFRAAAST